MKKRIIVLMAATFFVLAALGTAYADYYYTPLNYPGANYTGAFGINDAGTIVGRYTDASGNSHGFSYNGTTYTPLDYPGASSTVVIGINDAGTIVGRYTDASDNSHGFSHNGTTYTPLDYPGASYTGALGINDAGTIVGVYADASGNNLGFLAHYAHDFNADGKPDLIWQNQTTGEIGVWFMNGTTMTGFSYLTPDTVSDLNWKIVGVSDFNGDGKPDILWQHQTSGNIDVWTMNVTTMTESTYLTPGAVSDLNWKIVGVGDFNGDGKPDILWQHQQSGNIAVWFMNGTTMTWSTYLTPDTVSDLNWKIVGR
jgi:probable HAF family extracellular repeat protein